MKVCIINLGCKVNQCECDSLVTLFEQKGYEVCQSFAAADVYVINTCAVTQEAEKKSRQCVARVRKYNPAAKVYVIGCASQKNATQFLNKEVAYVGGTADKAAVCALPEGVNIPAIPTAYEHIAYGQGAHTRAFVKIQDGCNNFCSYCIVPYLRGRSRSRSIEDILAECKQKQDCKEIVLTGINVSAYGPDIGVSLCDLILVLKELPNVRFRFGSLEANVIDRNLLESIKLQGNFCDHFHLSLQSGDDDVLKAMNRHYTASQFAEKVALIRSYFPDAAITTDIIVGYPTETDQAFANSVAFAKEIGFSDIHVFPYSRREGTAAYRLSPIDPQIMEERVAAMTKCKHQLQMQYLQSFVGRQASVLVEQTDGMFACGHTSNYIKLYIDERSMCKSGEMYSVRCIEPFRDGMLAERV